MGRIKDAYTDHRGRMPHQDGYCFDTTIAAAKGLPRFINSELKTEAETRECGLFHLYIVDEACRTHKAAPIVVREFARILDGCGVQLRKPWNRYIQFQELALDARAALTCAGCGCMCRPGDIKDRHCIGCWEGNDV